MKVIVSRFNHRSLPIVGGPTGPLTLPLAFQARETLVALRICHKHCTVTLFVMTSAKTSLTSLSWYAHDVDGGGEGGVVSQSMSVNVSQSLNQ